MQLPIFRKPVVHFLGLARGLDKAQHWAVRLPNRTQNSARWMRLSCYNPLYFHVLAQNDDRLRLFSEWNPFQRALSRRGNQIAFFLQRLLPVESVLGESHDFGLGMGASISICGFFGVSPRQSLMI